MTEPIGRRYLPHEVPPDVSFASELEVFFITICCEPRGENHLAYEDVWQVVDETLRHRESQGLIIVKMALAMPDHFHGLFSFPTGGMSGQIASFKRWVTRQTGVCWQRGYFDHRIRSWESGAEKADYIRQNPVRAGLIACPEDWPYQRNKRT